MTASSRIPRALCDCHVNLAFHASLSLGKILAVLAHITVFSSASPQGPAASGVGKTFSGHQSAAQARMGSSQSATRTQGYGCEKAPAQAPAGQEIATFAGGCFWGVELAFQRVPGVSTTMVGYTQGPDPSPTYETVCSGGTGHTEAVQVYYNPSECTYDSLLNCFFQHVDPTTKNRQGMDMGTQYRSGIYFHNEEQKAAAEKAIAATNEKLSSNMFRRVIGTKVVSELLPAQDFYIAEKYHQQYLAKGGRFSQPQDASKGATEKIRCYG
ncbi:hypothetical protein WJX73_000208 [Symbiochloris irregularis]|uniref:peptide-methionine (S)-S-oxide reductase n=1 Tax=Symbiochloris irregularis TaxID=706552 RepID=A0AAW1NTE4_9CHLO